MQVQEPSAHTHGPTGLKHHESETIGKIPETRVIDVDDFWTESCILVNVRKASSEVRELKAKEGFKADTDLEFLLLWS